MRRHDAAVVALAVAEAAADAADKEYAATEGPEREAAGRALSARHVFENARDIEKESIARKAEPANLAQAKMRTQIAGEVAEHEAAAAGAHAIREEARRALEEARDRVRAAKAAAAKAEAAMDDPLRAELDDGAQHKLSRGRPAGLPGFRGGVRRAAGRRA